MTEADRIADRRQNIRDRLGTALLWCMFIAAIWAMALVLQACPAQAQSPQAPPSISQSVPDVVTVNQLMAIIAERDRQYSQRFDAQEKSTIVALAAAKEAVQAALIAAKEAVQKAEIASEKRFDSVNEFRNTLKDQQLLLMTRSEADARLKDIDRRITENAETLTRRASEARGAGELWGVIIGVAGLVALLVGAGLGVAGFIRRRPVRA